MVLCRRHCREERRCKKLRKPARALHCCACRRVCIDRCLQHRADGVSRALEFILDHTHLRAAQCCPPHCWATFCCVLGVLLATSSTPSQLHQSMKDPAISWRRCALASALLLFIAALANNVRRDTALTGAADAVEPACLATTNHTCAGHRDVVGAWWQPARCLVCVWQKCDRFTGRGGCAPIEPLQKKEWRHDARKGDRDAQRPRSSLSVRRRGEPRDSPF